MSGGDLHMKSASHRDEELRVPALQVQQGPTRTLYTFAVDGKTLGEFAAVSRLGRDEQREVVGYQRPEVVKHIGEIRRYLESGAPMIPNAIVIAFDERVRFEAHAGLNAGPYSEHGELVIPLLSSGNGSSNGIRSSADHLPGWIVDGQQRAAAIREADVGSFPICVTAFIASDPQEQREQFILVNTTKPLPRGLIYELLPTTEARLPTLLQKRRFPSHLMDRLNRNLDSPFYGLVRTPTNPDGIVADNSVLRMLENSLTDGALHVYRDARTGKGDEEAMLAIVSAFWHAVREVFPEAWGKPPRHSRLMHGAGIVAMGHLMDAIADRYRDRSLTPELCREDLEPLVDVCRWTYGNWDFGGGDARKWDEVQNTSKDTFKVANLLLVEYKRRVWSRRNSSVASGVPGPTERADSI